MKSSADTKTTVRGLVAEEIQVHGCEEEESFVVFIGFGRHLEAELAGAGEALGEEAVVDVVDLAHLEVDLVVDVVLDDGAVTTTEKRAHYALLARGALHCVDHILCLARVDFYFGIGTAEYVARAEPALHPQVA